MIAVLSGKQHCDTRPIKGSGAGSYQWLQPADVHSVVFQPARLMGFLSSRKPPGIDSRTPHDSKRLTGRRGRNGYSARCNPDTSERQAARVSRGVTVTSPYQNASGYARGGTSSSNFVVRVGEAFGWQEPLSEQG